VTIVVPTYREAENIPHLVARVASVREREGLDLELLFMDDDSQDGSEDAVRDLGMSWVHLVRRTSDRGLSQAVLDGLRRSERDVLVVMDADLSHPPEILPTMLDRLDEGADFVIGSRWVHGGSTDADWGLLRWINSKVATLLALPLTPVKDPMSGFFALRRSTFERGRELNPIGYKIGLELMVKCSSVRPLEIPIHFSERRFGKSKLSLKEQLRYLQHLRRLYIFKYGTWSHLLQFLVVGASGLVVNLAVLTVMLALRMQDRVAIALAIALSMVWNFGLNRRFSFSYARSGSWFRQLGGFVAACSVGAVVNYFTTLSVWETFRFRPLAAVVGVAAGTAFNFVASRWLVFRRATRPPAIRSVEP
jgi:dolichol-phosphate mannosyltransferase